MRVVFLCGYEFSPDAWWRVVLPSRHFRAPALMIGADVLAHEPEVLWVHEPIGPEAVDVMKKAKRAGITVVADFCEDVALRGEVMEAHEITLKAAADALQIADVVVATSQALADAIGAHYVVPQVLPLDGWEVAEPDAVPVVAWWSDGRQKRGLEDVAPALRPAIEKTGALLWHISFPHQKPFGGLDVKRQHIFYGGQGADSDVAYFRRQLGQALVSLDCWPSGDYGRRVSDTSILRAAALGVPALSTRQGPPGTITAPPGEWGDVLTTLVSEPGTRRALSLEARKWAETRQSFALYEHVLQEVCP